LDKKEKEMEKRVSQLELEDEELDKELSIAQKKALIKEAKKTFGPDWKKILLGAAKHLRINKETLQTLHGMGVDSSLRQYNDPRMFSRRNERIFKE